jgi:hypothetical protein
MNNDLRKKIFDESHDRAVLQAMSEATDDLFRRRRERQAEKKDTIETRPERIEKRLESLELKK